MRILVACEESQTVCKAFRTAKAKTHKHSRRKRTQSVENAPGKRSGERTEQNIPGNCCRYGRTVGETI